MPPEFYFRSIRSNLYFAKSKIHAPSPLETIVYRRLLKGWKKDFLAVEIFSSRGLSLVRTAAAEILTVVRKEQWLGCRSQWHALCVLDSVAKNLLKIEVASNGESTKHLLFFHGNRAYNRHANL